MKILRLENKLFVMLILLLSSFGSVADGAHVHGLAHMSIALDDHTMVVQLTVSAHDILGFERNPVDQEEQALLKSAMSVLKSTDQWLLIQKGACAIKEKELINPFVSNHTESSEQPSGHFDFELNAVYNCDNSSEIEGIDVNLSKHFDHIHHIEVQWLAFGQQGLINLSESDIQVRFN